MMESKSIVLGKLQIMPGTEALEYIKDGYCMRREAWANNKAYCVLVSDDDNKSILLKIDGLLLSYELTASELLYADWTFCDDAIHCKPNFA